MAFDRLWCLLNRHKPHRDRVDWDGHHYVSECRNCARPIRRMPRGGWRARPAHALAVKPDKDGA